MGDECGDMCGYVARMYGCTYVTCIYVGKLLGKYDGYTWNDGGLFGLFVDFY
jgi:hypothetical protein